MLNVQFHLSQEAINQFTAVIVLENVLENTNQMILVTIDNHVMTEVPDTPEMTEVPDTPEMTEVPDTPEMTEVQETTIERIQL